MLNFCRPLSLGQARPEWPPPRQPRPAVLDRTRHSADKYSEFEMSQWATCKVRTLRLRWAEHSGSAGPERFGQGAPVPARHAWNIGGFVRPATRAPVQTGAANCDHLGLWRLCTDDPEPPQVWLKQWGRRARGRWAPVKSAARMSLHTQPPRSALWAMPLSLLCERRAEHQRNEVRLSSARRVGWPSKSDPVLGSPLRPIAVRTRSALAVHRDY